MKTTKLHALGRSLWLDNITRALLTSGTLQRYVDELGVTGLTSNPTIFDNAIKNSSDYDDAIRAHSAGPGKGTEFVVRLPLDAAGASEVEAGPASAVRRRRRVLIVEDNVDAALSLQEALELDDHEVAVAFNGPDSLAKAREFHPEVILCDVGLPGMDGYEVARAVRADVSLRGALLVALTGYALPDDLRRASEAGFERHMAKPPNREKLEQLLAEVPERAA